jgi:molecular chaperone GrpE
MSDRLIFQALNDIARRIDALDNTRTNGSSSGEEDKAELDKQIKRLSREVFKTNTLVEAQSEQNQQALAAAQAALHDLRQQQGAAIQQAKLDLIKALLPVLDGIDAGLRSGAKQVKTMFNTSPEAARALATWLKGQQLLRERLLKLLETEGVTPIAAVGQLFDPYQHVAVNAANDPNRTNGLVLAEERRGYQHGDTVLRYADVIVNRHTDQ